MKYNLPESYKNISTFAKNIQLRKLFYLALCKRNKYGEK